MYRPRYRITPALLALLTEAAESRAELARASVELPWLSALQRDTASRLAHSTTAIEGNALPLGDVEAIARGETTGATAREQREVRNALKALRWMWARTPGDAVEEKDLLKLHALLVEGLLPKDQAGRYKTKPNRLVDHEGRTVHRPPAPEAAGPLTRELLDWLAGREAAELHPVVTQAIAHHRLLTIHPFADGNGRAARALGLWVLHARGFDAKHLLALDEFYLADRRRYYDTIQQARDLDEDLTYWLEYAAEGARDALRSTRDRAASLRVKSAAPGLRLSARQEEVLRLLRDKGRVKSPELEAALGLTRARVSQIVKPLVEAGLVRREGRTRATTYRLAEG